MTGGAVPHPEVLSVSYDLIPEGSNAEIAAMVRFGNGEEGLVEMFTDARSESVDFRGLPEHLANEDNMNIRLTKHLGRAGLDPILSVAEATKRAHEIETRVLFEFAIGARQQLWEGAQVEYSDKSYDPTSPWYDVYRFTHQDS